jgi:LPXTG-motif cell wall-anchored protein
MQSLIHGNFQGAAQKKVYALVGAAAAIAAAVGPLLGGFITTYLSWRVGFALEVVVIAVVLSGIKLVKDVPYTGPRQVDIVGAVLPVLGMGGIVLGILVWQEGGEAVGALLAIGAVAMAGFGFWLVRRKRQRKATLIDPDLFKSKVFRFGITEQMLQQIALGGTMIALPIYLQMVLEYNAMQAGLSLAPLSLTMFGVALLAGKRAGNRRPAGIIRWGFVLLTAGLALLIPIVPRADSGWYLLVPLVIAGSGLGLLVSQLNNYTLAPIQIVGLRRRHGPGLTPRTATIVMFQPRQGWVTRPGKGSSWTTSGASSGSSCSSRTWLCFAMSSPTCSAPRSSTAGRRWCGSFCWSSCRA